MKGLDAGVVFQDVVVGPAFRGSVGNVFIDRTEVGSGQPDQDSFVLFDQPGFVGEAHIGDHGIAYRELTQDLGFSNLDPDFRIEEVSAHFGAQDLHKPSHLGVLLHLSPAAVSAELRESHVVLIWSGYQRVERQQRTLDGVGKSHPLEKEFIYQNSSSRVFSCSGVPTKSNQHALAFLAEGALTS